MRRAAAYLSWLRKGLIAVAGAGAAYGIAISAGSPAGAEITPYEWAEIVIAGLVAAGVIAATNGPRPSPPAGPSGG